MPADYNEHHGMSSDLLTSRLRVVVTLPQREKRFSLGGRVRLLIMWTKMMYWPMINEYEGEVFKW